MSADKNHVFEEFKRGVRPLFIIRKKGVPLSEVTWRDIVVQKWQNGVRLMFWAQAAQAEAFILKGSAIQDCEVQLISSEELWPVATRIWGPQVEQEFSYFLSE